VGWLGAEGAQSIADVGKLVHAASLPAPFATVRA